MEEKSNIAIDLEITSYIKNSIIQSLIENRRNRDSDLYDVLAFVEDLFILPAMRQGNVALLLVKPGTKGLVVGAGGKRAKEAEERFNVKLYVIEYDGEEEKSLEYATRLLRNYSAVRRGRPVLVTH